MTLKKTHPVALFVTLGVGYSPIAPGTFGSLLAFPIAFALFYFTGPYGHILLPFLILILTLLGIYASNYYMQKANRHDPKEIIIDEVVGQLITIYMVATPVAEAHGNNTRLYGLMIGCFLLFRLFDIIKKGPVGYIDRNISGGMGVMLDDVVAGLLAGASLMGLIYLGL